MRIFFTVLFVFCLFHVDAQEKGKLVPGSVKPGVEKVVNITPEIFGGGYPAIIFNAATGSVTPVKNKEVENFEFKSSCFYIEPRDPEFSALDEEGKEKIKRIGNGDRDYANFKKSKNCSELSESIGRSEFKDGNVFYFTAGRMHYLMQIIHISKEEQVLIFKYKRILD